MKNELGSVYSAQASFEVMIPRVSESLDDICGHGDTPNPAGKPNQV
jgi:hypothetical protein